jgi:hypothetical protein
MIKLEIIIPNKANNERLKKFNLLSIAKLSNISGNCIEPSITDHKIHINNKIRIETPDIVLSLKNPPGYVEITIVIITRNNKNNILPYEDIPVNLSNKLFIFLPLLPVFVSDKVKTINKYKNANTEIIIVNNKE